MRRGEAGKTGESPWRFGAADNNKPMKSAIVVGRERERGKRRKVVEEKTRKGGGGGGRVFAHELRGTHSTIWNSNYEYFHGTCRNQDSIPRISICTHLFGLNDFSAFRSSLEF